MRHPLKLILLVSGFVLAVPLGLRADVKPGDVFPPLPTQDMIGGPLPAFAGRVTLVDFWASWCTPCRASFPSYARLQADYGPRGFTIVAVSADEDLKAYISFIRKFAPPFVVVRDAGHQLAGAVQLPTMPTSYLIGRDGRVQFVHEGFHSGQTEAALRAEIRVLLAAP